MIKIAIIIGNTRPGRKADSVAKWVYEIAKQRSGDAQFEIADIKDYNLPLLDEPVPPSLGQYSQQHTRTWAAKIASFDVFVFVTPEYNHGIPGALKNAIDYVYGRAQVMLSLYTDFENLTTFKPAAMREKSVNNMLDQLVAWGGAMKTLRCK